MLSYRAVDPANPILQGTSGDDNWLVKRNADNLEITLNSTLIWATPFDSLTSLAINGLAGNDTLTVDLSSGDAIPSSGITFNGGNPTTAPGRQAHRHWRQSRNGNL